MKIMKFIKNSDGDLINIERMEYIFLLDQGEATKERFEIVASGGERPYVIKKYRSESAANGFLHRLYQAHKFEVPE